MKNTEILTAAELAERLKVKTCTIKAWAKAEKIPLIRINSKVLRFDFKRVIEALRETRVCND